jgi:CRISPR-associated exonuclease Cas4
MAPFTEHDPVAIRVTDLKNYTFCPRFPYFERCLDGIRPRTYMMEAGEEAHEAEKARARRRTLWAYGVPEGQRQFNVYLESKRLGLSGIIDELVLTASGEYFPVDYKLSPEVNDSHAVQLCAYALLLEEHFQTVVVQRAFVYFIGKRAVSPVTIDAALRQQTTDALRHVQQMIRYEHMPPPVKERAKCRHCEWRLFCNDVV